MAQAAAAGAAGRRGGGAGGELEGTRGRVASGARDSGPRRGRCRGAPPPPDPGPDGRVQTFMLTTLKHVRPELTVKTSRPPTIPRVSGRPGAPEPGRGE